MMTRVPRRAKGQRIPLTVRLPFDEYREVARRAEKRNWSISDYVAFCIGREIKTRSRVSRVTENATVAVDAVFRTDEEYGGGTSAWRHAPRLAVAELNRAALDDDEFTDDEMTGG